MSALLLYYHQREDRKKVQGGQESKLMPGGTTIADFLPEATTTFSCNYIDLKIAVE